jgi:hypothetical protein
MRDKDGIILENLYSKILLEKYYDYNPPSDKKMLMYDFYVINYLQYLLPFPSHGFRGFRELPVDIVDSVNNAANKLYPYLKKELLDAVFFSICAEFRHFSDYDENYKRIENLYGDNETITKFFNMYDRYNKFYKKNSREQEELTKIFGVEKPSAKQRPPEIEKREGLEERVKSYKGVNYALEQTGMSRAFFVTLARDCYIKLRWNSSYGGDPWCGICKGYLLLDSAEGMEANKPVSQKAISISDVADGEHEFYKQKRKEKESRQEKRENAQQQQELTIPAAIDHIYDLQHNTDTVFNKLRSYYQGGYGWIDAALSEKANVKSYYDLLKKTSGTIRALAPKVLYNKLGETWESYTKDKTPDSNNFIPKIRSKEKKCSDILNYVDTMSKSEDKKKSDDGNFEMKPVGASSSQVEPIIKNLMYKILDDSGANPKIIIHLYEISAKQMLNDDGDSILPKRYMNFSIYHMLEKKFVNENAVTIPLPFELNPFNYTSQYAPIVADEIMKQIEEDKAKKSKTNNDEASKYSSSNFSLPELNAFIKMPEDLVWRVGKNYGVTKDTLVAGKDQPFGGVDMGMSLQVSELNPEGEIFEKIGKPFKIPSKLEDLGNNEKLSFVKYVTDSIYKHKNKILSQDLKPNEIKEDEVTHLLEVMTMGGVYGLGNSYYMKWKEGAVPQQTTVQVWGPNGLVTTASEFNAKSRIKELTKKLNDDIKGLFPDKKENKKNPKSSTGVQFWTNEDIVDLVEQARESENNKFVMTLDGELGIRTTVNDKSGIVKFEIIDMYASSGNLGEKTFTQTENLAGIRTWINMSLQINHQAKKQSNKKQSQSSADGILNPDVYMTGNDVVDLLKKPMKELMELKDGYYISYWKSRSTPSKKEKITFRIWKMIDDDDFELVKEQEFSKYNEAKPDLIAQYFNKIISKDKKIEDKEKDDDNNITIIDIHDLNYIISMAKNSIYSLQGNYVAWKEVKQPNNQIHLHISKKIQGGKLEKVVDEPFNFENSKNWDNDYKIQMIKYLNNVINEHENGEGYEFPPEEKPKHISPNAYVNDEELKNFLMRVISDDSDDFTKGLKIKNTYTVNAFYKDNGMIDLNIYKLNPNAWGEEIDSFEGVIGDAMVKSANNNEPDGLNHIAKLVDLINSRIENYEKNNKEITTHHLKSQPAKISEKEVKDAINHVINEEDPDFDMDIGDFTIIMNYGHDMTSEKTLIKIFIKKGDAALEGPYEYYPDQTKHPEIFINELTIRLNNFMQKYQDLRESFKQMYYRNINIEKL